MRGSPFRDFRVSVAAGAAVGSACSALGEAVLRADVGVSGRATSHSLGSASAEPSNAAQGEDGSVSFTVVARDMHFNKLPRGGDFFDVKLVPAAGQASAFESCPFS